MNIYKTLNEITNYIDDHIEEKIDYNTLARMMGVNSYTMQRVFSVITGITLTDYIRKRKLSLSAKDISLGNYRIIDIALKYGYENATSFSRAFTNFHGLKPSEVKKGNFRFKNFSKIMFDEEKEITTNMDYEIINKEKLTLYGKGIKTDCIAIKKDAPNFFSKTEEKYKKLYGKINYGMILYKDRFNNPNFEYWVLWNKKIDEFEKIEIPKSKWLVFHISNTNAKDIQKTSEDFYNKFIPSCKYNIREIPELEYYHDDVVDFLVPIETNKTDY